MSHKKHITKNLIALSIIGAIFSGNILAFGDFSPNALKTFIPYGPEASTSRIAFGPPAGMGIDVTALKDLPDVVNIMNKMGYKIPTLTNSATSIQPYMSEIEAGTPSTELLSIVMSINPTGYVASAEGATLIAELKKDLNIGKEITDLFKSLGCASECDNLDTHYQDGINTLQTQQQYFAGFNLSDLIKDAIKIAPGLVPSEKPTNIEDITKKFEWLIGKSTALGLDNSAIKASLIKLNNLGKEKPQEKPQEKDKIIAPSGGGNGGGGNSGGGASAAKAKAAKKELSKDKSSKKSVKKSEAKSESKSKAKIKSEVKSKDKTSKKSVKKSKSKDKTSKKSVKKSKSKSKDKSSRKKSTKKSKSKTKKKPSKTSGDIPTI